MGKNIQRVQDMLDGNFKRKIQVGYTETEQERKIGDRWFDSDGKEWEQKNGYIASVKKTPDRGIALTCEKCKQWCTNRRDRETYNRMNKCFTCQINYEVDLKTMILFYHQFDFKLLLNLLLLLF